MPYIRQEDRNYAVNMGAEDSGDLNFLFTHEIKKYMNLKGVSYKTINDVIGALEGAKLEFYRRVAAPYEDTKIEENGDVY
jgi:predicted DNA-binding protein with PD1-like motif